MKIHEYQAKELLKGYDIPVQDGVTIEDMTQAEAAIDQVAKEHDAEQFIIKAQVHAGGRGKGGGVKFSPDRASALESIQQILGMTLVTHQTGAEGRLVKKGMVAAALDNKQEFYAAITLDRYRGMDVFMVSSEGGMEIEQLAVERPEALAKIPVDALEGVTPAKAAEIADAAGFAADIRDQIIDILQKLWVVFTAEDATLVETPQAAAPEAPATEAEAPIQGDDDEGEPHA